MRNLLQNLRKKYFKAVAQLVPKTKAQIIVLTHILPDRQEMLEAISNIAPISLVIAIPYSINPASLSELKKQYLIVTPTLDELLNAEKLTALTTEHIYDESPIIIMEIGGYFASALPLLQKKLQGKLLGIIEDTEAGHREYEKIEKLDCPIVSVARSSLKETEDMLIGNSCLFSTESLLRKTGFLLEGKQVLVLGYGKIGRSIAFSLLYRHCRVLVYDISQIRRILALSENFHIPDKEEALKKGDIIFGATGNYSIKASEFPFISNGSILISCSSKAVEFDLDYLKNNYSKEEIFPNLDMYKNGEHFFYMLASGLPVNFLDDGVVGPVLALVQAEMIFAINKLVELNGKNGIYEVSKQDRENLAEAWIHYFCDQAKGFYRHVV